MITLHDGSQVADTTLVAQNAHKYPRLDSNKKPLPGHGVYAIAGEELTNFKTQRDKDIKTQLAKIVPLLRREVDNTVLTVGDLEVKGDAATRSAISETLQFINELGANAPATIDWNAENGFFSIDKATLANIGIEIGKHRQKSFTAKKTLKAEIKAGTITTVEAAKTRFAELMEDYEK